MHSRSKRRGAASQEVGGFAIDIAVRTTDGSPAQGTLIAASTGDHRKIAVGKGIVSKSAAVLFTALMKILLVAELIWGAAPVKRVHSDREPGIVSSESRMLVSDFSEGDGGGGGVRRRAPQHVPPHWSPSSGHSVTGG